MKTYIFHEDPGHGWMAVKRTELTQLNILHKISFYSYQSESGTIIYLEEDRDASLFIKALTKKLGIPIKTFIRNHTRTSHQDNTFVRHLSHFKG